MYAPCSITVGSVSSWTPSSTVNLAKCAKWMKEVLSTASQIPTQRTAEPTTKKAKLKRQRMYLAHVAPQSATMLTTRLRVEAKKAIEHCCGQAFLLRRSSPMSAERRSGPDSGDSR